MSRAVVLTLLKLINHAHKAFDVWLVLSNENERYFKKLFSQKLISVLFKILKDKDDYLDATMLIQEIILQNPKR